MRAACAVARRELASYYRLPVGWIVTALFVFLTGVVFAFDTLEPGEPATMRYFFVTSMLLLTLVAPAVSMRLFAEEVRTGSIEPLMTTPASDGALVMGKYIGACAFVLFMLAATIPFPIVLFAYADPAPDIGPVLAGYGALFLVGMLYIAIGTFASSLTSSQTLAFLATLFVLIGLLLLTARIGPTLPEPYSRWVAYLSLTQRIEGLAKGVVDVADIVFILSGAAWFLMLAVSAIESRRWR